MIKDTGKVIQLSKKNKVNLVNTLVAITDNPFIQHFRLNSNNCIVRFIPKNILDDFNDRVSIQNSFVDGFGENLVYGQLFTNSLWDDFTYNPISYSPFSHTYVSNTMGHYGFRSKTYLFNLLEPMALEGSEIYNDVCVHSYIRISDFPILASFIENKSDYYMVITHGYLLYEDFNKGLSYNFDLLSNLIPFETYKRDYIYRMSTPLHIYNGCTHTDFLRLSFIGLTGYLSNFEQSVNPFMVNGNTVRTLNILKNECASKINKNGKLFETKKSIRLLVPNNDEVSKIVLDIHKDGVSVNSISNFKYPDIKNIGKLSHDISENFIHDNISGLPTLSYGLSNILDLILKDYTRSCCDGREIERGIIHLDLNDFLDVCNPIENKNVNCNSENDYCFYNDWKCLNLLDIVEVLCENSPISFEQFKFDFLAITDNISSIVTNGAVSNNEIFKYKSIPFILLFDFILYRLTGRLSGTYKEKLLKVHPNVEISTNGLFNYSSTIDKYIKYGTVELENKCPKNVQKIEKEYDWSDLEGFSLTGNDLIENFKEDSAPTSSFDPATLGEFGNIDFSENVEEAKSLTSEDLSGLKFSEDSDIEDITPTDLAALFGTPSGLDLSFESTPKNSGSDVVDYFGEPEVVESEEVSELDEEDDSFDLGAAMGQPYLENDMFNPKEKDISPLNSFHSEFDSGLSDFFKTSPYFDNKRDVKRILLDDIFNPGLDYSTSQIKSLIVQDVISIESFRKELLHRVIAKINSNEDIFDIYNALKNLF